MRIDNGLIFLFRIEHFEEKNQQLMTFLDDSENNVKALKEEISAKEMELLKMEKDIELLKSGIKEEQEKKVAFDAQQEETMTNLSNEIATLKLLKEDLETKINKIQNANNQLEEDIKSLENRLKEEQDQRVSSEETFSKELATLKDIKEEEIEAKTREIQKIQRVENQLKKEIESLEIQSLS